MTRFHLAVQRTVVSPTWPKSCPEHGHLILRETVFAIKLAIEARHVPIDYYPTVLPPRIQLGGAVASQSIHVTCYTTVGRDDIAWDLWSLNEFVCSASQQLVLPPAPPLFLLYDDGALAWQPPVAPSVGGGALYKSSFITLSRRLVFILWRPEREIERFLLLFELPSAAITFWASFPGASLSVFDLLFPAFVFPLLPKKFFMADMIEVERTFASTIVYVLSGCN